LGTTSLFAAAGREIARPAQQIRIAMPRMAKADLEMPGGLARHLHKLDEHKRLQQTEQLGTHAHEMECDNATTQTETMREGSTIRCCPVVARAR
jgi:hypothetical protein